MALKEADPCDHPNDLRVIEYNPNQDDLTDSLGLIDEERLEKQMKESIKIWNESTEIAQACVKISRLAENANELAFMFLNLGKMSEQARQEGSKKKK